MAEQPNISQILAALGNVNFCSVSFAVVLLTLGTIAAQRPAGTPTQPPPPSQAPIAHAFPPTYSTATPPTSLSAYPLPQPTNTGSLDLSNIKPVNSGSVSIAEAIAKARGIAAEKGVPYDAGRSGGSEYHPKLLLEFGVIDGLVFSPK